MRLLRVLAAAAAVVAGFVIMHHIDPAGSSERPAQPKLSSAAARPKTRPLPTRPLPGLATGRLGLGVISDNLPLFERQTRIRPALTATYINWGVPFPAAKVSADHALGATTLIVLEPRNVSAQRIAAGQENSYLASFASAERRLGLPVILSFAPEANGDWYTWGEGHVSPALYKRMYRYVHYALLRYGARHLTWLWQVNRSSHHTEPLSLLWPGPKYVDAVGIDGQLKGAGSSFYTEFAKTVAEVRRFTSVRVMLSEVGVKPGWSAPRNITGLVTAARKAHLVALNLFDVEIYNFDNDRLALAAVRRAAAGR